MEKSFWENIEKQWRKNISQEFMAMSCAGLEVDVEKICKKQPIKNIWDILDDEDDDDDF